MATDYTASDAKNDIKNAARDTAQDVKHGASKLADQARTAFDDATSSGAMADAKHKAQDLADAAREKGQEVAENVRSEANRLYRAGERRAGELAHQAEDYYDEMSDMVRRQPAAALGIAAGVGFLIGLILARR